MKQRLLEILFGVESAPWEGDADWRIEWLSLPEGDGAFGLLLLLLLAGVGLWFLFRWEARRLAWHWRAVLLVLRGVVITGVIAMLMEPVLVMTKRERVPSHLLVLVDRSQSMGLRDAWQDEARAARFARALELPGAGALRERTRMELLQRVLDTNLVNRLAGEGERLVHVHPLADRMGNEMQDAGEWGAMEPAGQTTALGGSLRQALEAYRGLPLAGVLLFTDGQSNAGEALTSAAKLLEEEGVPLVGVLAGTREGPRNASIFKLEADPVVFVRDNNRISVFIESRGMRDVPATAILERRESGGPWIEIEARDLVLGLEGQLLEVPFEYSEPSPGKLEFRARLDSAGAELTADDNVALAEVRVIRQKLRVLFVAGSTFPEVQFLRNALYRDRGIEVSTWNMAADNGYEHPGDNPIRRLPRTQEELNEFDCVVLYDPDPRAWEPGFTELLSRFVAREGGGLIFIAGEMQTAQLFDRQDDPEMKWLSLLPVIREPGLFRSQVQIRLSARQAWHLDITEDGREDRIFQFAEEPEENARVLRHLPGMFWHFPVTRAKPGATVLARHGDPRMRNAFGPEVLLATQLVGPGRTFFVGFDSTYRWRFLDEQFFDGFWARMVDRAGRARQLGGVQPFVLASDRTEYRPGDRVTLTARFRDPADRDPGMQVLHGEVERVGGDTVPLTLQPSGGAGEFSTAFEVARPGPHVLRVWTGGAEAREVVKAARFPFEVKLPNLELENPAADPSNLETASLMTGGRLHTLADGDRIPEAFTVRSVEKVLEDRQEVWDAPLIFWSLFLLLCAEWVLRKRLRLV